MIFQGSDSLSVLFLSLLSTEVGRGDSDIGGPFKNVQSRGAWVAQLVRHLAFGFGAGPGLMGRGMEPSMGLCARSGVCLRRSLPLPLPLPCTLVLALSL